MSYYGIVYDLWQTIMDHSHPFVQQMMKKHAPHTLTHTQTQRRQSDSISKWLLLTAYSYCMLSIHNDWIARAKAGICEYGELWRTQTRIEPAKPSGDKCLTLWFPPQVDAAVGLSVLCFTFCRFRAKYHSFACKIDSLIMPSINICFGFGCPRCSASSDRFASPEYSLALHCMYTLQPQLRYRAMYFQNIIVAFTYFSRAASASPRSTAHPLRRTACNPPSHRIHYRAAQSRPLSSTPNNAIRRYTLSMHRR